MDYKAREDNKILDDIKSSGKNYLAIHMEDILSHIDILDDRLLKAKLVESHYKSQRYFSDKNIGNTRTRVNSLIRIIQADKVIYALEQVKSSNSMVKEEAIEAANETIRKINSGEIKLPRLDQDDIFLTQIRGEYAWVVNSQI